MGKPDIRWIQRFQNFENAFLKLKEAVELKHLNELERNGLIQRFEFKIDLSWKVMKDFLEEKGFTFRPSPKDTFRLAQQSQAARTTRIAPAGTTQTFGFLFRHNSQLHLFHISRFGILLQHTNQFCSRHYAGAAPYRLAVLENNEGGYRHHLKGRGNRRVAVYVNLVDAGFVADAVFYIL